MVLLFIYIVVVDVDDRGKSPQPRESGRIRVKTTSSTFPYFPRSIPFHRSHQNVESNLALLNRLRADSI